MRRCYRQRYAGHELHLIVVLAFIGALVLLLSVGRPIQPWPSRLGVKFGAMATAKWSRNSNPEMVETRLRIDRSLAQIVEEHY